MIVNFRLIFMILQKRLESLISLDERYLTDYNFCVNPGTGNFNNNKRWVGKQDKSIGVTGKI
jgi:hypothetical protein